MQQSIFAEFGRNENGEVSKSGENVGRFVFCAICGVMLVIEYTETGHEGPWYCGHCWENRKHP